MKTALKRLSGASTDVLMASGEVLVKTIVLANTQTNGVSAKVYIRKSGSGEDFVVFHGNVYPKSNVSVYLSKDIQLYLSSGDVLVATAKNFDESGLGGNLVDLTVSYEGDSTETSSSSSSSGSSSSSSRPFLNYNRSSSNLSSHVNWGLLRAAVASNYENWGSA